MNGWFGPAVGAAFLAMLVHVVTVLIIPIVTPDRLWSRLEALGVGLSGFTRIPDERSSANGIAGLDPATIVMACRYDLSNGGIRIAGRLDLDYWAIWLHNETGFSYYAINARANGDRALEIRVMTEDQLTRFRADLPDDAETELLVASPTVRGFVTLRALVTEPSARADIERETARTECRPTG